MSELRLDQTRFPGGRDTTVTDVSALALLVSHTPIILEVRFVADSFRVPHRQL